MRTGVAISDPTRSLATPLGVVASGEIEGYLRRLVDDEGVREVVVGVPRIMSGGIGFQAERTLIQISHLKEAFPLTSFIEWDERMTTRLARPGGGSGGAKSRGRRHKRGGASKERVDHLAAARILQEYLDYKG